MSTTSYNNPVTTLLAYIHDIKPYHTKVAETVVELVYHETLYVTIKDIHDIRTLLNIDHDKNPCLSGYDMGDFDGIDQFGGPSYRYSIDGTEATSWCGALYCQPDWTTYVSPTTVAPAFIETMKISEIIRFTDKLNAIVHDGTNICIKVQYADHFQSSWSEVMNPIVELLAPDTEKTVSPAFIENFNVYETILLRDVIGVTICDPNYDGSRWEMDWGLDEFWDINFPNQTGWDAYPHWDANKGIWYGGDAGDFPNGAPVYTCVPGSLVGGFDDSFGFDGFNDTDIQNPGFDSKPIWNSLTDNINTVCSMFINTQPVVEIDLIDIEDIGLNVYQTVASASWNILHFLHRYPIVRVYNDQGTEMQPNSIVHNSTDSVTITFNQPITGIVRFI